MFHRLLYRFAVDMATEDEIITPELKKSGNKTRFG